MESGNSSPVSARDPRLLEHFLPLGIVGIVLMMVLPIPRFLVDGFLAISLALSIGVFMIGLFMESPLQFSSFPAVILVATLLRLSMNVATTRLILLNGSAGPDAAGSVIAAFGRFVIEGNVVVGLVVFLILVVINFVVITKGAGRVAEVAARFALDGMPGRQMAIDADLNAGVISPDVARVRRSAVEREADFFGAMDGASKFVKGDAIAGLLITAINLVGGLLMGLAAGMDVTEAAETFSVLSVGDALVSQMPALMISTAAGVVVTRSATGDQLGRALGRQLLGTRQAVTTTAGVLALMALLPGMPAIPFLAIAGSLFWLARSQRVSQRAESDATAAEQEHRVVPGSTEDVESALPLDVLALEVGLELVHVVDPQMGGTLVERIAALRRQYAVDMGLVIPPIHIRDNLELNSDEYRVLLLGTEVARTKVKAGCLLAMDATGHAPAIDGEATTEPAFGSPARWVSRRDKEMAEAFGYTVVDHTTIIATHVAELVRQNAHNILGRAELQQLLDVFSRSNPKLVEDLIPNVLALGDVLKVLRNLIREGVSIRDLRTILEGLAEFAGATTDPEQLTELTRQRLSRQLTSTYKQPGGSLSALVLSAEVEEVFRASLRGIATGSGGALDPRQTQALGAELEGAVGRMQSAGLRPCAVVSPDVRRYLRAFAERRIPNLAVLSFRELEPNVNIQAFETVSIAGASAP
jgi:flagellar biosynthesis protein FlhA